MGDTGLEDTAQTSGKTANSSQRCAKYSALGDDPDLARVIDAWPMLSDDQRAAVLRVCNITQENEVG